MRYGVELTVWPLDTGCASFDMAVAEIGPRYIALRWPRTTTLPQQQTGETWTSST